MKKLLTAFWVLSMIFTAVPISAHGGTSYPTNPQSVTEQLIDILLNSEKEDRIEVIDLAIERNVTIEELIQYLTTEELEYAYSKIQTTDYSITPRMIPSLNISPIMQERNNWCGATTVQIVLTYLNGTSPSQSTIVSSISNSPSIDAVTAYINNRITTASLKYTYGSINISSNFKGTFDSRLASALQKGKPMILQIANPAGEGYWPYPTNGHYCLCDATAITYSICDPYYYEYYDVEIEAGTTEGRHLRMWSDINAAIINWANTHTGVGYTSY